MLSYKFLHVITALTCVSQSRLLKCRISSQIEASVMKREVCSKRTLDSGLSWLVVPASFLSQFVVMGVHNVFGLLFIELLKEFSEGKATIGEFICFCDNTVMFAKI